MDQVFTKSRITEMISDLKKIIKESKQYMEDLRETAGDIERVMSEVPLEAVDGSVSSAVSALRTQIDSTDLDTILTALDTCKTSATELIPSADSQYGKQTDALTAVVGQLNSALSQLQDFLTHTPLTVNYEEFQASLDVTRARCNGIMEDAMKALNKLLMNIKGEETKSVWYSKDPVNLCTGNFIYSHTDLTIKSGEPFIFRRFYNSVNDRCGVLGRDWNHNFEIRLETDGQERILSLEDGKEERFIMTSTGTYMPVFQSNGTLTSMDGGYEYRTREQKKYQFDTEGYCISQKSLADDRVFLLYETIGAEKRLKKIERESGESFALTYHDNGYLCTVSDHTGRCITYKLEDDLLTGVSTPDGHWHQYRYTANGKLECVQNPEKVVTVENEFDGQMRTTRQYFPDGGKMSYSYDDEKREVAVTERNGSRIVYVHDEKFRDIKHIYSNGEERFAYNKRNQRTMFVDKLGNKTQYFYDPHGNRTRIINALGNRMDLQYNERNQLQYAAIDGKQKVRNHYDDHGNLVKTQDGEGNMYQFHYKKPGQAAQIIQPDGGTVCLEHDARGNVIRLTDPNGVVRRFVYDDLNQVVETVDGNGNRTFFTYDSCGNIKQVRNPQGKTRKYTYNANHKVTKIEDFDGSVILREYNALNRPCKVVDKMGRATLLTYDPMWNLARVTQPDGAKTTFIYDEHNHLTRIRNANGDIVRYGYDAVGNRTEVTNELGYRTKFVYDALGRLIEAKTPEGYCSRYEYNADGQVTRVQDALGNEVHLEYDGNGRLLKETSPLGESRSYTYTVMGQVRTITNEVGQTTTYTYEKGGRIKQITYPEGGCSSYTYDNNGNVKTFTNPKGHMLTYTYDELDQVVRIEGSEGEIKSYQYDSMGNVLQMTDGRGAVTRYEYSLTGKVTKVTDPLGNETQYQYDDRDRLLQICQYGDGLDEDLRAVQEKNRKNCRITRYEHDLLGRTTKSTDGLGHTETYEYDAAGQLLAKIDRDGYLTRYGYTPSGTLDHIQYADGREVKLSYNPIRQLQEIQDWLGITKIEHDAMGRVQKVIYPDSKDVSYTYGPRGERTSITYPDGKKVTYEYDEYTRLCSLNQGDQKIGYEYDYTGSLSGKSFPNGTKSIYHYDEKGQLRTLLHQDPLGILDEYHYGYDPTGNKISVTKQRRGLEEESGDYHYGYDLLGRLTSVTKDGIHQRSYTYDAFGNRTGMTANGGQTSYEYNAVDQLIARSDQLTETSYTYDKRGNLSQISENGSVKSRYIYGSINQLEEVVNRAGASVQYRYDGMGYRVGKSVAAESSTLAAAKEVEYRPDITRPYNNLLQKTEAGSCQTYLWDSGVVGLMDQEEPQKLQYYLQDELGSPIRLLYQDGEVKECYGYDEFGQEKSPRQTQSQPFGYTGYQQDPETGISFAQARYYQPETGRFLSQDVIPGLYGAPVTRNRYSYCFNHPTSLIDQDGLLPSLSDIGKGIKDTLDNWGDVVADGVDTIAEAVSMPVGVICSNIVEWGSNHPIAMLTIRAAAKTVATPICNDSWGVKRFTEATQSGAADELLAAFDFHRDEYEIFHTSKDCWQKNLGYNDLYDWAFDAGTSMRSKKYPVVVGGEEYCIWMWKGDYVNLGAGAETGIYKGGAPHWDVAYDDSLPMDLALYDKDGNTIFVYDPKDPQWWITGFDPMMQGMDEKDLMVIGSIDFRSNPDLWRAFYDKFKNNTTVWCFDTENKTAYYKW